MTARKNRFAMPAPPVVQKKQVVEQKQVVKQKPHPLFVQMLLMRRMPEEKLKHHISYLSHFAPWLVVSLSQA